MSSPRSPLRIVPDNEPAGAPLTSWYTQGVTDGFGDRLLMFDNAATGPVELLRVRSDFATAPGFESALRARLEQLASFTHPGFAKARVVNHLENGGGLTVASTYVTGTRLSELFVATRPTPGMHPASVRDAFGELVASIAELHRQGQGVAHGALGAERVLLTFDRQLVVTDYVFGEALRQLNLTQEQLWTEFGLVSDAVDGATLLDQRGDLAQLGLLMMSLVLGRRVSLGEYPHKIPALLRDFSTASDRRAPDVTAPLRSWLEQALDTSGFRSAEEAERALLTRPRRPHSINLQAALPSRVLGSPRVASTEAGLPPRPTPPVPAPVSSPTTVAQGPVTPSVPQVVTPPAAAARPTPVIAQAPVIATPSPSAARVQVTAAPAPIVAPKPDAVPPAPVPPSVPEVAALADAPSGQVVAQAPPAATPAPAEPSARPVAPQPVAVAPLETLAPAPVESPATLVEKTSPVVTPPVESESPEPVPLVPVEQTVPPLAMPAPPVEPRPTVAPPVPFAAEPPADAVPSDDLVFLAPLDLAPLDLPPSRFLKLQPTPPAEPRVQFVRLHTPAEPPIVLPPPVAPAPRPDAPMARPEPFSWIADAQPMDPVDAVVASAPRSTPLLRWVTAALGILVITQGVIIVRLLSRQPQPAAATEQVLGTTAEIASGDKPSSVTPPLETAPDAQNGLAQDLSRVPASRNNVPPAASPQTPNPTSAADSTAGTRRTDALGRTGGIKIVSTIPLQVMLGDKLIGSSQRGPVFTTPGTHDLDFVNDSVGFRVRQRVLVTVDKVVSLRINPPNGSVNVTAKPWAQVWIDGRPAGNTPLDASVSLGEHEIVFRNPQLGVSRQKVVVQVGSPARVSASFTP